MSRIRKGQARDRATMRTPEFVGSEPIGSKYGFNATLSPQRSSAVKVCACVGLCKSLFG